MIFPKVKIYTGGSKWTGHEAGGWAAILLFPTKSGIHQRIVTGQVLEPCTNIRCEMLAAINGLRVLKTKSDVLLITDLQMLCFGLNIWMLEWKKNGWRNGEKRPVKNVDLWTELYDLVQKHTFRADWTRGHIGNEYNELADELAGLARQGDLTNTTRLIEAK